MPAFQGPWLISYQMLLRVELLIVVILKASQLPNAYKGHTSGHV